MITIARAILVYLTVFVVTIAVGSLFMDRAEARTGVIVYKVIDQETAARVVTDKGVNLMCLLTPEGHGWTGDDRWVGLTCAVVGSEPQVWQFCRGTAGKPSLLCTNSDTEINGVIESADPGNKPKIRMRAF